MKWFRSFKIGTKLILGFSFVVLLVAVVGFVGNRVASSIDEKLEEVFTVRLPSVDYLAEIDRDLQQLLVAERSMVFVDTKSDMFKALMADYEENLKQSQERWDKYKALPKSPEESGIVPKYEQARSEWQDISQQAVEGRKLDTREGRRLALDLTLGEAREKFEAMRDYLDQLQGIALTLAETDYKASSALNRKATYVLSGLTAFSVLIGLLLAFGISRGIGKSLRKVIGGLSEGSYQVTAASAQVASASQSLAEGASEQAAAVEESSSALEEMASMTRQNAGNAKEADALMRDTFEIVEQATNAMVQLTASMGDISKASEETQKIIKTIDEIAFQTNLLALNAAVEAARAGEAGAGFAVVADEVRNLAMRAAEAAKTTADLIDESVKRIQEGSHITNDTNQSFEKLGQTSKRAGDLVSEIAAASEEQAEGIEQINRAIADMDKVVQQSAANAEETASSSEELNAQAVKMREFVASLTQLVGSNGVHRVKAKSKNADMPKQEIKKFANPAEKTSFLKKNNGARRSKDQQEASVPPEQIIPFDESGFQEF